MYKLIFNYSKNNKVDYGDQALTKNYVTTNSAGGMNFETLILHYLMKDIYPEDKLLDDKILKLEHFIKNNFEEMQILNLDIRSTYKSPFFGQIMKQNNENNQMPNVAFVFKCSENITQTKFNTISLFCTITQKTHNSEDIVIFIDIKRIEFLSFNELPYAIKTYSKNEIKFDISSNNEGMDLIKEEYRDLWKMFKNIKKISGERGESESFNSIFKFNEWYDLIMAQDSYYGDKNDDDENNNWLINIDEIKIIEKDFQQENIMIGLKKNSDISKLRSLCIIDINDENNLIPIKIKNSKEIKLLDVLNEDKEIKKNNLDNIQIQIQELKHKINIFKSEKAECKNKVLDYQNIFLINQNIDSSKEKETIIKQELDLHKQTINRHNKEIEKIVNNFIKEKKEKKIAKMRKSKNELIKKIDEINDLLITGKNKFNIINEQTLVLKEKLKNVLHILKISLNQVQDKISKLNKDIKDCKLNIDNYNKNLTSKENDQMILKVEIELVNKYILNLKNKKFAKIIECDVTPNYREEDKKIGIEIANLNKDSFQYHLATRDKGTAIRIRRLSQALNNAKRGFYRNPYFLYSLFFSPESSKQNDIKIEKYTTKYNSNKKQAIAIQDAISARDCFYLQGPPGTGKTQVISAIAEYSCDNDQNVIITSSTHEAISNFFDRLAKNNQDNPNLILYKTIAKDKTTEYGEETIFPNFINKILNFSLSKEKESGNIFNLISQYKEKFGSETKLKFCTDEQLKFLLKDMEENREINYIDYLTKTHYSYNARENLEDNKDSFKDYKNSIRREKDILNNQEKYDLLNKIHNHYINNKNDFPLFENINELEIKKTETINSFKLNLLKNFESQFAIKKEDEFQDRSFFINYIIDKKIINVIGLTTTARPTISLLNNNINIFSEYPIDLVVIDEISKSTTPEIISRGIFAKKIIFAGDYKQLPPKLDIDPSECKNMFDSKHFEKFKDSYKLDILDDFVKFIEKNLYGTSFFNEQVKEIKKQDNKNSYGFLNVQHRFNKNINNVVNNFYNNNESLEMPNQKNGKILAEEHNKKFNDYQVHLGNNYIHNDDFMILDTSYLNQEYLKMLLDKGINSDNLSFDQKDITLFTKNTLSEGIINEYNAFCISQMVKKIIINNKVDLVNKIGVIAMVRNQVKILTKMLKSNQYGIGEDKFNELKIKVDTVDNFQGREKDIIVVDFIRAKNRLDKNSKNVWPQKNPNLDFVRSPERINVALSRAESKLILVGAFESLLINIESHIENKKIYVLQNIYNFAKENDWVYDVKKGL